MLYALVAIGFLSLAMMILLGCAAIVVVVIFFIFVVSKVESENPPFCWVLPFSTKIDRVEILESVIPSVRPFNSMKE